MRLLQTASLAAAAGLLALAGCKVQRLTAEEASAALEESAIASQAESLMSASVEISTDFTIGQAVQRAADEVRAFVESQLPCAEVTLQDATLTIEYGANPGNCTFRGHAFSGSHSIEVERNDADDIVVQHTWDELSNGKLEVSGEATVTWSASERSRRVVHELTWTRLSDGRMGVGSGDRTQTPLPGGIAEGIEVSGERAWEGERGRWELDIDQVQLRWQDPAPQSGAYVLQTPFDKTVTLRFERADEDTLVVTASGGGRSITLRISTLGIISRG